MAITDALVPEFDHEMATTRRVLDRVPDAQLAWKPHEKSWSFGQLATHLSHIPFWCTATLRAPSLDLATIDRPAMAPSHADLMKGYDERVAGARTLLAQVTDSELMSPWTLKNGDQEFFTMPKISVLRTFVMNHSIHHRAQLCVYLRLNNISVPPIYGPTADEQ
jgi:uncharacterized damage-inducible protein DinB